MLERRIERLRLPLCSHSELPTGGVVGPLDGALASSPGAGQDQVPARISLHRSRHSSPIRAPWPNLPARRPISRVATRSIPCRVSLSQKLHRASNPTPPAASALRPVLDRPTGRQLARLGHAPFADDHSRGASRHKMGWAGTEGWIWAEGFTPSLWRLRSRTTWENAGQHGGRLSISDLISGSWPAATP
jgi:hypothetical protein